jgi:hypothetical protein
LALGTVVFLRVLLAWASPQKLIRKQQAAALATAQVILDDISAS